MTMSVGGDPTPLLRVFLRVPALSLQLGGRRAESQGGSAGGPVGCGRPSSAAGTAAERLAATPCITPGLARLYAHVWGDGVCMSGTPTPMRVLG